MKNSTIGINRLLSGWKLTSTLNNTHIALVLCKRKPVKKGVSRKNTWLTYLMFCQMLPCKQLTWNRLGFCFSCCLSVKLCLLNPQTSLFLPYLLLLLPPQEFKPTALQKPIISLPSLGDHQLVQKYSSPELPVQFWTHQHCSNSALLVNL